ncbi:cell division protein FtsQ/DivIB [Kushneria aurantia]|uniref:Cell division protein FtsQ n=1 Tax=Kushneria aurantia TaxID=504092 RepID=A0ABV6G049_9GAMM|nr:cell division protein FtsQ/DivIB [Kushneria aurantia]
MSSATSNRLLGLILIVALLGAGGRTLWLWLDRPIERVTIDGDLQYVNADYLRSRLAPLIVGESWLSVNLDRLRDEALQIPWLKDVRLARHWPDELGFELTEQRPVAWWNDHQLLNVSGEPFDVGPIASVGDRPHLAGPRGSGSEVLAYYDALEKTLAASALEVTRLRLEPRGAWRMQLDNAFWVILGRTDLDMRLERFKTAWQRGLSERRDEIDHIDLRYPNGVAVTWREEEDNVSAGQDE